MQIAEYNHTEAALAVLKERYEGATYEVTTTAGMALAKAGRAEIRGYRTSLEKMRVELKAPALEHTRLIDSEAKWITAILLQLEDAIDAQIKAEESRKEAEKVIKAEAERMRIANSISKIEQIKAVAANVTGLTAEGVNATITKLEALAISSADYQEFQPIAEAAKTESLIKLNELLIAKLTQEAEEDRQKAERAERDRLAQIEAERLAAEQAILAAERAEFEAEKAKVAVKQAEDDRMAREAKAVEQAETDRKAAEVKKEEDRVRAEQQEKDRIAAVAAKAKQERAEAKAAEAEKARKLAEARCNSAEDALKLILALCQDEKLQDYEALIQIALIAEGNIS